MTELLEIAVAAARELTPDRQDEMARVMLALAADDVGSVELSAEELASLAESRAAAARGEFATEEQVRAVWAKYGL